jgi:hypothetical protein
MAQWRDQEALQKNQRGPEVSSQLPSPLAMPHRYSLLLLLGFLFVVGLLLAVLLSRSASTTTALIFTSHYNHLPSA